MDLECSSNSSPKFFACFESLRNDNNVMEHSRTTWMKLLRSNRSQGWMGDGGIKSLVKVLLAWQVIVRSPFMAALRKVEETRFSDFMFE